MPDLKLHDRLAGHGEPEMAGFDDARMNRSDRHLEHPFALNVTKRVLPLCPFKDGVPWEIFFEGVSPLGPMLMPDESPQVRMPGRNEAEHIPNVAFVPLGRMDVWRDRMKETIPVQHVGRQENPVAPLREREQVAEFVPRL